MTSKTPAVALGTWAWGDSGEAGDGYFGSRLSTPGLREVVEKAHSHGFTVWDTAAVYGMGRSETVLAQALKGYDRSEYQLSTKFTPQIAGDVDDPVADMPEQSLDRLGTEYVNLYWIHNPADVARWTPLLIPLLESGKIKHVGVSNHDLAQIALADQILGGAGFRVEAVQNHYSLLYRSSERAGILDHCREHDVRFFSYMVLEQGALTGTYGPAHPLPEGSTRAAAYNGILPQLQTLTERMRAIGEVRGAAVVDVATAWAIAKGTTPIIGVTKAGYIDGLCGAHDIELAADEIAELEALADTTDVDTRAGWEREMQPEVTGTAYCQCLPSVRVRTYRGLVRTTDPRNEVREFLSTRRARITPEEAGLSAYGGNRRVKGLRREEVAMLAGVSVDYYVRMERGSLTGASDGVVEALADALRLDDAERAHLFALAFRRRSSPPHRDCSTTSTPRLPAHRPPTRSHCSPPGRPPTTASRPRSPGPAPADLQDLHRPARARAD